MFSLGRLDTAAKAGPVRPTTLCRALKLVNRLGRKRGLRVVTGGAAVVEAVVVVVEAVVVLLMLGLEVRLGTACRALGRLGSWGSEAVNKLGLAVARIPRPWLSRTVLNGLSKLPMLFAVVVGFFFFFFTILCGSFETGLAAVVC